ncbi:MAG: hypothetical protein IT290_11140 [Deltaproteobacteria bacterium]|nr:hypothetical protein [Deltaproteobacteria bacterium]
MNYGDQPEKSLLESLAPLLAAFFRYWRIALGPALALLVTGAFLAARIPSYYNADARILMQPQRINSQLLETGNREDKDEMKQRLESLAQEILSRPRLRSILERYQIYPESKGLQAAEAALVKFRENIEISPVQSPTGGSTTQVFRLGFSHSDPKMTYDVARALSSLFIEESIVDLRAEAQGAEEFFDAQVTEARKRLEETESKRQAFISANFGKLPEHIEQSMARLQTMSAQLDTNAQLIAANMQRRANLETLLAEARKYNTTTSNGQTQSVASDPAERIAQLESALVVLRSRYSDQHPDVIKVNGQLAALRAELAQGSGKSTKRSAAVTAAANPLVFNTQRELAEVETQLAGLRQENSRLQVRIDELQGDIQQMPVKEQDLLKINRDYENVKSSYDRLLNAREQAGLQTSLIRSQKGEQFRIIDPVELPRTPAGPPRLIILGGAIALSLAMFVAIPFLMFLLNSSYRTKEDIESELGVSVIGVIPQMLTPESVAVDRRLSLASFLLSASSAVVLSAVIFFVVR